jgi:ketosteroid isomerase-like protein
MKKAVFSIFFLVLFFAANAQSDSSKLVTLNQQVDSYVVSRNIKALDSLYADDFVFSHGSGRVEGKAGWMKTVERANYPLRQHDSVKVELHENVAVVKGKMDIQKVNKDKTDTYHLRYIRIYALRNKHWQLISHNNYA